MIHVRDVSISLLPIGGWIGALVVQEGFTPGVQNPKPPIQTTNSGDVMILGPATHAPLPQHGVAAHGGLHRGLWHSRLSRDNSGFPSKS